VLWVKGWWGQGAVRPIEVALTEAEKSQELMVGKEVSEEMAIRDDKASPGQVRCYDPATGCLLGTVAAMTAAEVDEAAGRARRAQEAWRETSFEARRRVLRVLLRYVVEHQEEICVVNARDSGKPRVDALLGEIMTTCEKISYVVKHGEAALAREYRPTSLMTCYKDAFVEYHPLGVIGVIAPWNYPFHNMYNHIASGIFAGNAVVVKVSEYTSWSAAYYLRVVRAALEAEGHDPDLVQVITGFGEAGAALVASPDVDKVLFTGSPGVGKLVMRGASAHLKPVVLELGGKDPMVVCEDANVDAIVPIACRGVYQNSGQNCCGIERVILYDRVHDEFVEKVVRVVSQLRQGPPLGPQPVDVGAMVTPQQLDIIQDLVDDAVAKGATVRVGGRRNTAHGPGLFYEPTVLVGVTSEMRIAQEEVFGPVMAIFRVTDDDHALRVVNDCDFGLGACVFCKSDARGERLGQRIRSGMTCINDFATNYLVQSLPFGGIKHSGFDRFAGPEGLRALCLQKSVVLDKVPFIRTTIPGILQYPIKPRGFEFGQALVRLIYGSSLSQRLASIFSVINP